jgi:hypothetical protein
MDKLLTKNGRIRFNLILCACGILLMVPVGCFNTKFPTETTKMIGNIGLFAAWFIIVGLVLYIEHSVPTIPDLLNAVEKEMGEFKATAEAWSNIKTKHLKFGEMSVREKLFEISMIIMGIGFMVYGILDYCNLFPVMKIREFDGSFVPISHWASGSFAILVGFIPFIMAQIFRFKIFDKWEERFKELLKEVDDEMK